MSSGLVDNVRNTAGTGASLMGKKEGSRLEVLQSGLALQTNVILQNVGFVVGHQMFVKTATAVNLGTFVARKVVIFVFGVHNRPAGGTEEGHVGKLQSSLGQLALHLSKTVAQQKGKVAQGIMLGSKRVVVRLLGGRNLGSGGGRIKLERTLTLGGAGPEDLVLVGTVLLHDSLLEEEATLLALELVRQLDLVVSLSWVKPLELVATGVLDSLLTLGTTDKNTSSVWTRVDSTTSKSALTTRTSAIIVNRRIDSHRRSHSGTRHGGGKHGSIHLREEGSRKSKKKNKKEPSSRLLPSYGRPV